MIKIIILLSALVAAEDVRQTNIESGVYKESLGDVMIMDKKVEVWVKLNLTELSEEVVNLDVFRTAIWKHCYHRMNMINKNMECGSFLEMS